jgi:hypothetical protein
MISVTIIESLGWAGTITYLVADSLYLKAFATTGLNVVWVAMSLFTLGRKWLTRN